MADQQRARLKLGLALSGGTLKAAAHAGVLAALESAGIRPQAVAGSSAGSFIAALYAHGVRPERMERLVERFPSYRLLDYGFPVTSSLWRLTVGKFGARPRGHRSPPNGLLHGRRLERYFAHHLPTGVPRIPYYVVAIDLYSGEHVVYGAETEAERRARAAWAARCGERGVRSVQPMQRPARVIRASCSLPGIFTPVAIDNRLLVDAGLREYVPVDILRQVGCTHILAVNLHRLAPDWQPDTIAHVVGRSFDIIVQETAAEDVEGCDVLTVTPEVGHMTWISFGAMQRCVFAGRRAVAERLDDIRTFLAQPPGWTAGHTMRAAGRASERTSAPAPASSGGGIRSAGR
ncbi:MAG: patatin-like phospholipase family protein [Alicyclobacillus sp.]|nr:patatin-like phospholipase family protein [Alicyclobacillus sp.]